MEIKKLRLLTKLSQSKFAKTLGIPIRTIQQWEQEVRKPPEYIINLIKYFLKKEELI